MKSDVEIARECKPADIYQIAEKAGIHHDEIIPFGVAKAKVTLDIFSRLKNHGNGKLILVTTMNPTAEGEGKTTVTIGLSQALAKLGKNTMLGIREPSLRQAAIHGHLAALEARGDLRPTSCFLPFVPLAARLAAAGPGASSDPFGFLHAARSRLELA